MTREKFGAAFVEETGDRLKVRATTTHLWGSALPVLALAWVIRLAVTVLLAVAHVAWARLGGWLAFAPLVFLTAYTTTAALMPLVFWRDGTYGVGRKRKRLEGGVVAHRKSTAFQLYGITEHGLGPRLAEYPHFWVQDHAEAVAERINDFREGPDPGRAVEYPRP